MARPNSHDRAYSALYLDASPQGNLLDSYAALVLQALAARDAAETLAGTAEVLRQVNELVGPESLAAVDLAQRLNTYREKSARGQT